jgi:hypothetical protein
MASIQKSWRSQHGPYDCSMLHMQWGTKPQSRSLDNNYLFCTVMTFIRYNFQPWYWYPLLAIPTLREYCLSQTQHIAQISVLVCNRSLKYSDEQALPIFKVLVQYLHTKSFFSWKMLTCDYYYGAKKNYWWGKSNALTKPCLEYKNIIRIEFNVS